MNIKQLSKQTNTSVNDIKNFMINVQTSMVELKLTDALFAAKETGNDNLADELLKICVRHANGKIQAMSKHVLTDKDANQKLCETVYNMLVG